MQGHPMIKQMSEEKERGLEIKQRVVRRKRKSLDSAPTALSLEQFKKDERNKRRREAYARKKQLLIHGEHSMVKQMSEEKERGLEIKRRVVLEEIAIGNRKGEKIFLHRIALQPSDKEKYPVAFTRKQFPVKLCFAMTINKAQGRQTLQNVGIYLREPVFSHGQLYVALSRALTASAVKVLIEPADESESNSNRTRNVVYKELLALAESS